LWSKRYQEIAKAEFVDQDISSVLEQFENISTYESIRTLKNNQKMTVACLLPDLNHDTLQEHEKSPTSNLQVLCLKEIKNKRNKRKFSSENPGMTPARILFDSERWTRSTRCDYCNLAGGDLECRTCDVIAHASCYLSSQDASKRKETGSFDILTIDPSWFCEHCHKCMLDEFNKQTVSARQFYLESRKNIFGKVIQAYVRMSKDASLFQKKKNAIVRIQAATRGKLARSSFNNLQRMRLKSYSIEMIRIKGLHRVVDGAPDGNSTSHSGNLTRQNNLTFRQSTRPFSPKDRKVIRPMISGEENKGEGKDELRLSNGFSCNPFLCVSIVDGIDDEHQIFW
jgi:predicted DNA-binding ribbon-helix-helix protein